ncbi:hypothetical protein Mosig_00019 [Pelagibacter phage Mosig EXVC030M]|jgi:hypothetical protein|nr:hypothetical protein Mosig_00019 [Pelagibacter phage Mosig EXVC030M]
MLGNPYLVTKKRWLPIENICDRIYVQNEERTIHYVKH